MVKQQIHDEFKSFHGSSIIELSKTVSDFVVQSNIAAKSLAVVFHDKSYIVSIGFRSSTPAYPVSIESVMIPPTGDIDLNIMKAADSDFIGGDVICHSLYKDSEGNLYVAFLLHE
jgi:hypothetical protein